MVLIENEEPQEYLMDVAADCGWNVQALQNWKQAQGKRILDGAPSTVFTDPSMELWINTCLYVAATAILLWGATNPFFKTTTSRTFQTFSFSVLFAQFGTLLRWTLSRYNGSITAERWKWLPIGTFAANMLACILSSGLAAANLIIPPSFPLAHVFISALKSGFAGSLSTVSTFVVESAALLQSLPQHALGYYYSVGTIVSAALLGIICYAWAAQW
jgi:fluoride ion exporter CrcB/FEX